MHEVKSTRIDREKVKQFDENEFNVCISSVNLLFFIQVNNMNVQGKSKSTPVRPWDGRYPCQFSASQSESVYVTKPLSSSPHF